MRTIGLIGGMSWESSAEYYRILNQAARARLGPLRSAQILMHSVDFGPIERAQHEGRWGDAADILQDAARRLHAGGADCIVLCTNTMHKVAREIARSVPIPFLHIGDPVGRACVDHGWRDVGLLGTGFTMREPFLIDYMREHFDVRMIVPSGPECDLVHRVIYEELCAGIVDEASRRAYVRIIDSLAQRGASAIVLGCTEIELLITQADSPLPVLDTTQLHAMAALEFALG
ncbi:MAG: aspartate/glutamate racemase family protein [Trinickia sp.]|uniref:aspartate/glutamate racemase family protein n=1 Tax=Trinickia sp. TaxID=2571163 RepID=UPI003F7EC2FE